MPSTSLLMIYSDCTPTTKRQSRHSKKANGTETLNSSSQKVKTKPSKGLSWRSINPAMKTFIHKSTSRNLPLPVFQNQSVCASSASPTEKANRSLAKDKNIQALPQEEYRSREIRCPWWKGKNRIGSARSLAFCPETNMNTLSESHRIASNRLNAGSEEDLVGRPRW